MMSALRIGFVGLGGMGRGLVKNLCAKGFDVVVTDLDSAKVADAVSLGARQGGTPSEIAAQSDVFVVCVTTAEAVQALSLGAGGALAALPDDAVFLDHTTVSTDHVDLMRDACAARGIAYAEAPMTRTPAHADRGEVNVLFGGEEALLERLRPVFDAYAENVFHVGPAGHAIRLKLIHNYIAFANVAAWCEGFALAAHEGLDMSKVIGIISAAGGKSGMMDLYGEMTLRRDFTPHMSLSNAQKDVRYYAEWLERAGLPGFMAQSINQTYALASIMGHGDESCTAIIKAYEELTGVEATLEEARP
ncbi:NAD(P)-dependent oxidoreductase [Pseudoruegeria sp. SK021]|uniref:NAD(P)-dependent oxidoreductase n=1 Tax=Pseudoruegeria sp. SK021 TaxID=1933035 RepID=UPI0019826EEE|nr:NAD(P)-dependent oxidoreductase [Pseudoruegeria sp. SK021]